jgi:murein DD-endopeptidase MepM/ murein hydrolase activator NlpD
MTARFLRVLAASVALTGLISPAGSAFASSPLLTPAVLRGEAQAPLIQVAHHRRHRAHAEAVTTEAKKGGRKSERAAAKTVTVRKGDTVRSIAQRNGTTPAAIRQANPGIDPRRLRAGDTLKLPGAEASAGSEQASNAADGLAKKSRHGRRGRESAEASPVASPKTYTVRHGDTLYSIGRRFDVSLDELRAMNGLRAGRALRSGQTLKLERASEERPSRTARAEAASGRRHRGALAENEVSGSAFAAPGSRYVPLEQPVSDNAGAGAPAAPIPYTQLNGGAAPPPAAYTPAPAPYAPPTAAPYAPPATTAPYTPRPAAPAYAPPPSNVPGGVGEALAGPTDAQVAAAGRGRFVWPTRGNMISGFGAKPGGQRNDGMDIAAPAGTPVAAAANGDVVYAGNLVPGFGNLVLIKHDDGWVTAYAHLASASVKIKDHVTQGMQIGTVGTSGGVEQPQLHFEVRYATSPRERARPIDPALVLPVGQ